MIKEHGHFVQGAAWDPLNVFIATQSADRYHLVCVTCMPLIIWQVGEDVQDCDADEREHPRADLWQVRPCPAVALWP